MSYSYNTENVESIVGRAAQELGNEFIPGRGEVGVRVSTKDTKGVARYTILPAKGKSFKGGATVSCAGGNVDAIVGNGSDSIDPKEMGAIPLGVATAAHRVLSGKLKGPASEEMRTAVLASWNAKMKAKPEIRQDAADLLVRVKSKPTREQSKPYALTVLGIEGWSVKESSVPTSMGAWETIFTKAALASILIGGESVQTFVKGLVQDAKDAAEAEDRESVKATKAANAKS